MICCVSRAKMHFEHRKMNESCSFWLFFYIFSFSQFWPVLGWSDCQFRPRGSISSPGMVPDRSGPEFYIYSNFLFIWCSCADHVSLKSRSLFIFWSWNPARIVDFFLQYRSPNAMWLMNCQTWRTFHSKHQNQAIYDQNAFLVSRAS